MDDTDSELLRTLLKCFDRAMLVSRCGESLRARPMTVVQTPESRQLWLLCGLFGEDFAELGADPHVNVVMNDGLRFLSVTGSARVARPAAPPPRRGSQRRPGLVLLEVTPQVAEYWDRSTSNGVRFVADSAERPPPAERPFGARAVGDGDATARKLPPRRRGPFDNVIPLERPKWRR